MPGLPYRSPARRFLAQAGSVSNYEPELDYEPSEPGPHDRIPGSADVDDVSDESEVEELEPSPTDDDTDDDGDTDDDLEPPGQLKEARAAIKAKDFKKAFELLGVTPEDLQLDNKAWTAFRSRERAAAVKLKGEETAAINRLQGWESQLRAGQNALQTSQAELKERDANVAPIEQAIAAYERDGDPSFLVKLVEQVTKKPYDEAQRDILHKVKRSPGERRLEQQLADMKAKLDELQTGTKQPAEQDPDAVRANDCRVITERVDAAVKAGQLHEDAAKVPHFANRIRDLLIKTRGPVGLTMTPEQAARQVLRAERERIKAHPLLKRPAAAPATTPAARGKGGNRTPLRRDSGGSGSKMRNANESNDDIISELVAKAKAAKRAGGAR
jgi:hypothetical protein